MVTWFDAMSGDGMLKDIDTGELYTLHFTAIEGIHNNNHHWPKESDREFLSSIKGQTCNFTTWENYVDNCTLRGFANERIN